MRYIGRNARKLSRCNCLWQTQLGPVTALVMLGLGYLFSWAVIAPALTTALGFALAVPGFIPIKAKWLGIAVAILGIAGWIQISAQQRTTDRPPLDYVYFKIPEPQHQRITPDGKIQLWRVSTGLLKGVKIWGVDSEGRIFIAQKTISGGTTFLTALQEDFNEDVSPWSFFLPIGREYTIDIDHPNELGQLQERIKLTQTDNGVVQQIRLFRKRNGEVLLPRPIRLSPAEQAFLGIVLISFAVFGVTLIRYSWRA